jgi:hypothetical protein
MTDLTVPLAERVEYASPDWLATAQRFLEARAGALAVEPFSVARALSDAPPHLAGEGGALGYTLRLSRDAVAVQAGADTSADVVETADYNCALPFAWTARAVGGAEAAARARREYRHIAGARAPQTRRHREPPGATAAVLEELHDHLALRTVNNPDIRHRAGGP